MAAGPDSPPRRQRPIGHAVAAILIAFAMVIVLDADGMLSTARQLPYGSTQRAVAVALMRPVAAVTDALYLNRPVQWMQRAVGKRSLGVSGDPFASAPKPPPPPPPPKPPSGGTTVRQTKPRLTPTHPLRVLVAGDSLAGDFGPLLQAYGKRTGVIEPAAPVDFRIGTGLARPDVFDWPRQLREDIAGSRPNLVVLAFGLNDDQPMTGPTGNYLALGSPGWAAEYRRRVGAMMDIGLAAGAKVVYVAPPLVPDRGRSARYRQIAGLIAQAAARRGANVRAFNTQKLIDPSGHYTQFARVNGQLVALRRSDGVHLSGYGDQRMAASVLRTIGGWYRFPHHHIF
jgi:uncharacterized protein